MNEPATGNEIGRYVVASVDDLSAAASIAAKAQRAWERVPAEEKAAIMRRAGDLFTEHGAVFQDWLMREAGSGGGKAAFEAGLVASEFYFAAGTAQMPYGQLLRSNRPRLSMARRRPAGTVGVISPFNFPGILTARSVAPALALGNAVLVWVGKDTGTNSDKGVYASLFDATGAGQFGVAAAVSDEVTHDPIAAAPGIDGASVEVAWVRDGDGFLRHARLVGTWQAATTIEGKAFRTRPELVTMP